MVSQDYRKSWREDQFSEHGALFDQFVTLPRFGKRQHPIDDGFQLAAKDTFHHFQKVAMAAHGGSKDLKLSEENLTKVGLGSKAGCRAACQYSAAATR